MGSSKISDVLESLCRNRRTAKLVVFTKPGETITVALKHTMPTAAKLRWIDDSVITDGVKSVVSKQTVDKKNGESDTTIEKLEVTGAKFAIIVRRESVNGKPKQPRAIKVFAATGYNEDHFIHQLEHYVDIS